MKFFKYIYFVLLNIIKKPLSIIKVVETILYSKKQHSNIKSELIVIAVDKKFQSQGIGTGLIKELEKNFVSHNINEYRVTIHDEMINSNNFYLKNNFHLYTSFKMYNYKWNEYIKKIENA